jgi:hypothetical protein
VDAAAAADATPLALEGLTVKAKMLAMVMAVFAVGCDEDPPKRASKPKPPASASAAEPKKPEAKPEPPVVEVSPAIRFTVQSDWMDEAAAVEDALAKAQTELMAKLQMQEPPIYAKPTKDTIRRKYRKSLEREYPTQAQRDEFEKAGISPQRLRVNLTVELTEQQVRQVRSGERAGDAARLVVLAVAALAALYGFLRFDAWTRGYFTVWLGIAAIVAVAGALIILI